MKQVTININNPAVENFLINYSKSQKKSIETIINDFLLNIILEQDNKKKEILNLELYIENNNFETDSITETMRLFRDKKSLKSLLEGHRIRRKRQKPKSKSINESFYDIQNTHS